MTRPLFGISFVLGVAIGALAGGIWWPALLCLFAFLAAFLFVLKRIAAVRP